MNQCRLIRRDNPHLIPHRKPGGIGLRHRDRIAVVLPDDEFLASLRQIGRWLADRGQHRVQSRVALAGGDGDAANGDA